MSESNKYYYPKPEDIHMGLTVEYFRLKKWREINLTCADSVAIIIELIPEKKVRIKILDHADILECGFTKPKEDRKVYYYKKRNLDYTLFFDEERITIVGFDSYPRYEGQIANKSELKKLLRNLNP